MKKLFYTLVVLALAFRIDAQGILTMSNVDSSNVMLSWPTNLSGYVLQSKTSLGGAWNNLFVTVTQTNGLNEVLIAKPSSQTYFRLGGLNQIPAGGITAKGQITLSGNARVDSFNSSNGPYNFSQPKANALLRTLLTSPGAINMGPKGSPTVYGSVMTGPGGTVLIGPGGSVGDVSWAGYARGQIQPGHVSSNANFSLPDVIAPVGTSLPPSAGVYQGTNYTYLLVNGGYKYPGSLNISGTNRIAVVGSNVLYLTGPLAISGQAYIYILPGASLRLYLGDSATFGGIGNFGNTYASNFSIYGLPSCTNILLINAAMFTGTIYAPEANLTVSGAGETCGAFTVNSANITSAASIHYDESLFTPSH